MIQRHFFQFCVFSSLINTTSVPLIYFIQLLFRWILTHQGIVHFFWVFFNPHDNLPHNFHYLGIEQQLLLFCQETSLEINENLLLVLNLLITAESEIQLLVLDITPIFSLDCLHRLCILLPMLLQYSLPIIFNFYIFTVLNCQCVRWLHVIYVICVNAVEFLMIILCIFIILFVEFSFIFCLSYFFIVRSHDFSHFRDHILFYLSLLQQLLVPLNK